MLDNGGGFHYASRMNNSSVRGTHSPGALIDDILAGCEGKGTADFPDFDVAEKELPPGYRLRHYVIERTLGGGGFGITYLAREDYINRLVVIKENFPSSICYRRSSDMNVCVHNDEDRKTYDWALGSFLREARLLGSLNHPNIARVYAFFAEAGTAYYVTEYIEGQSLDVVASQARKAGWIISQDELYGLMVRVLDALDYLHGRALLHRDVKPDNIIIRRNGLPMLIDFGAVREKLSENSDAVVESAGFSPPEQSQSNGNMGPWTDIYAFGATLYYVLANSLLPIASKRLLYDEAASLAGNKELLRVYHPKLLRSIDKALSPRAEDRYQSVAEWMKDLAGSFSLS